MIRFAAALFALSLPAHAGDDASGYTFDPPLVPFVNEVADLGPLYAAPLYTRYSDDELRAFVFDGPASVPLPAGWVLMLSALLLLRRLA